MDVILKPADPGSTSWTMKDRLGRSLGLVIQSARVAGFEIVPVTAGSLTTIRRFHATLDETMTAIAKHMHGECILESSDGD